MINDKVGLIAGYGKLPLIWTKAAVQKEVDVHVFPIKEEYSTDLLSYAKTVDLISVTELNKLIDKIKGYNIKEIGMIGKVEKKHLFNNRNNFDLRFQNVLNQLDNFNDQSIMLQLIKEFEKEGIEVLKQTEFIKKILAEDGLINNIEPSLDIFEDMKHGLKVAKIMADLDIGQTVLLKDKTIIAVEAVEGTDLTIKRAGNLVSSNLIMAKTSRSDQDLRFDIPTIGIDTLENLIAISAAGLVIEADKTIILDKKEIIKKADKANLSIMSVSLKEV
ncbi:MAG: UDP-2,3-diacylglucosamine diphosphatase LpxI [Halanaerobiales bacterium]|nr:UDP-2,3-diacylglucosamine diphosphatase LpxI [Halanaerobiales bacterium]